jgi:hypothetical protein
VFTRLENGLSVASLQNRTTEGNAETLTPDDHTFDLANLLCTQFEVIVLIPIGAFDLAKIGVGIRTDRTAVHKVRAFRSPNANVRSTNCLQVLEPDDVCSINEFDQFGRTTCWMSGGDFSEVAARERYRFAHRWIVDRRIDRIAGCRNLIVDPICADRAARCQSQNEGHSADGGLKSVHTRTYAVDRTKVQSDLEPMIKL